MNQTFQKITDDCILAAESLGFRTQRLRNGACCLTRLLTDRPVISLLSGLHGDERVGPLFLRRLLRRWAREKKLPDVSLIIVPVLNDLGWNSHKRHWNRRDLNDHFKSHFETPSRELSLLYEQLPVPDAHLDIHEDCMTPYPYVWLDLAGQEDDTPNRTLAAQMSCGVVTMHKPDKSSTHFMRRRGCPWTITSEVPPDWPLRNKLRWMTRLFQYILKSCYT